MTNNNAVAYSTISYYAVCSLFPSPCLPCALFWQRNKSVFAVKSEAFLRCIVILPQWRAKWKSCNHKGFLEDCWIWMDVVGNEVVITASRWISIYIKDHPWRPLLGNIGPDCVKLTSSVCIVWENKTGLTLSDWGQFFPLVGRVWFSLALIDLLLQHKPKGEGQDAPVPERIPRFSIMPSHASGNTCRSRIRSKLIQATNYYWFNA